MQIASPQIESVFELGDDAIDPGVGAPVRLALQALAEEPFECGADALYRRILLRAWGGVEKCPQFSGEYCFEIAESEFSFGAVWLQPDS